MSPKLHIPLIAAWVAVALAVLLRVTLGAGNLLVVFTGVIALSVTAVFVSRRRSGSASA